MGHLVPVTDNSRGLGMVIRVVCEHCNARFKADDKFRGKRTKCPKCGNPLVIPHQQVRAAQSRATQTNPGSRDAMSEAQSSTTNGANSEYILDESLANEVINDVAENHRSCGPDCLTAMIGMRLG